MVFGMKSFALMATSLLGMAAADVKPMAEIMSNVNLFSGEHISRHLDDTNSTGRACGDVIGSFTQGDVVALGNIYLASLFPPGTPASTIATAEQLLLGSVQYNVDVVKVCMSCNEAKDLLEDSQMTDAEYGFMNYCGEGMFGADDISQSALLLVPVDPETGDTVAGKMQGLVQGHMATIPLEGAPTVSFPADLSAFIAASAPEDVVAGTADSIVSILFAAAGAVSIMPDYLGYGESADVQRAFFSKMNYAQSITLAWLAAGEYVKSSNSCSELQDATTLFGHSEGGYAVIAGAYALKEIGVQISQLYPSAAGVKPAVQLSLPYALFAPDVTPNAELAQYWTSLGAYLAYGYSIENPFLKNTGSGVVLAADEYNNGATIDSNLQMWFDPPTIGFGFFAYTPANPTDLWNADLSAAYAAAMANGAPHPCNENTPQEIYPLCEALLDGDLSNELENGNFTDFPVFMCYSPDDVIITINNAPDYEANEYLQQYNGVGGILLQPQGSHGEALIACSIAPIITLNDADNNPVTIGDNECRAKEDGAYSVTGIATIISAIFLSFFM